LLELLEPIIEFLVFLLFEVDVGPVVGVFVDLAAVEFIFAELSYYLVDHITDSLIFC